MPLVDIEVIEGVFDEGQKAQMIEKVTERNGRRRRRKHAGCDLGSRQGSPQRSLGYWGKHPKRR